MPRKPARSSKASTRSKSKNKTIPALKVSEVYRGCPSSQFKFRSTKDIPISHDVIAQGRAIKAINAGLGIRRPGYNIYVAGIEGTGKTSVIQTFLQKWSRNAEAPNDWIYLYNFVDNERPIAVELPRGLGKKLKKAMDQLIKTFKREIPQALQSEDYENTVNAYYSASNEMKSKLYSDLEKLAKSRDFIIKSTRLGI